MKLEERYYTKDAFRKLQLPEVDRSYLDPHSAEWSYSDIAVKIADLSYMMMNGFDISKFVHDWLKNHDERYKDAPLHAMMQYISFLRGGDKEGSMALLYSKDMLSLDEAIDLFCKEAKLRFEIIEKRNEQTWDKDECITINKMPDWDVAALSSRKEWNKEDFFAMLKSPTDVYLRFMDETKNA